MNPVLPGDLARLPLFAELPAGELALLAAQFRRLSFPAGRAVFSQGEPAREVYVLESGRVVVRFYPYDGGSLDIQTVHAGEMFGWSAVLAHPTYTSAAVCLTDCRTLVTRGSELRGLMRQHPDLGALLLERMARVVADRLTGFREQLARMVISHKDRKGLSEGRRPMERMEIVLPTMYGDHHVIEVLNLLRGLPGVDPASLTASAAWQRVEVVYDPAQINPEAISVALLERGYSGVAAGLAPIGARHQAFTEFAIGPGTVERFIERRPDTAPVFGPCPGFEVLHPGEVHPADL